MSVNAPVNSIPQTCCSRDMLLLCSFTKVGYLLIFLNCYKVLQSRTSESFLSWYRFMTKLDIYNNSYFSFVCAYTVIIERTMTTTAKITVCHERILNSAAPTCCSPREPPPLHFPSRWLPVSSSAYCTSWLLHSADVWLLTKWSFTVEEAPWAPHVSSISNPKDGWVDAC